MTKKVYTQTDVPEFKVVNTVTGEIISGISTVRCESIDDFIMCFLSSIREVAALDGNSIRVLLYCWKYSSFNYNLPEANVIVNDKDFKSTIRKNGLDMSDAVINNCFMKLSKAGMLIAKCRGKYILNPKYFFKGTLANRSKLQVNIIYDGEQNK